MNFLDLAKEEEETHAEEEDITMVKEEIMKNQTNDVKYIRKTIMKRKMLEKSKPQCHNCERFGHA